MSDATVRLPALVTGEPYGWAYLLADVCRVLDERGVPRRRWHDGDDTQRIHAAAGALLEALGVEGGEQ
jgi:hypothetical protein